MGWVNICRKPPNPKLYLDSELHWSSPTKSARVLASSIVDDVHYAAVEVLHEGGRPRMVFAAVTPTESHYPSWSYKTMDESMCPEYFDCPLNVLELLTPPTCEQSRRWRDKCMINHKRIVNEATK